MSRGVGAEISRVMRKQTDLEGRFEDLIWRETLVRAARTSARTSRTRRGFRDPAELRSTTNELCVNLKRSPDVLENLRFAVAERAELSALVAETLESLDEEGSFSRLVRKRVKEEARDMDMEATRAREKALSGEVAALRDRIAREKAEHETWAEEKAKTVATLKPSSRKRRAARLGARFARRTSSRTRSATPTTRADARGAAPRPGLARDGAERHAEIVAYPTREGDSGGGLETRREDEKRRASAERNEGAFGASRSKTPVAKAARGELAKKQARAAEKREAQARASESRRRRGARRRAAEDAVAEGLWQSDRGEVPRRRRPRRSGGGQGGEGGEEGK